MRRLLYMEGLRVGFPVLALIGVVLFMHPGSGRAAKFVEGQAKIEFSDVKELQRILDEAGYTEEAWNSGLKLVPRYYIVRVPKRWAQKTVKLIPVDEKKSLFFRVVAPLVLRANESILADRSRLQAISKKHAARTKLSQTDRNWLKNLSRRYRVVVSEPDSFTAIDLKDLKQRVDIIPNSLALAQAADESGWGTTRFVVKANAFFGQWTYDKRGVKPKHQREGKGDYRLAAFPTPLASVEGYMLNLNSEPAYAKFRKKRGELRARDQIVSGVILAGTLDRYSERGQAYIKDLLAMIRHNNLADKDHLKLKDMTPVSLVPVGHSARP